MDIVCRSIAVMLKPEANYCFCTQHATDKFSFKYKALTVLKYDSVGTNGKLTPKKNLPGKA